MKQGWTTGLPFDGICVDCKAPLRRGTTRHECGRVTYPLPTPPAEKIPAEVLIDRFRRAQGER